jgi:very-short-patch-repair endonuclease
MPHEFVPRLRRNSAKRLRQDQTFVERELWQSLRAGRFGGLRFKRQAPMGRSIVDFVCHEARVVVELDGSQHGLVIQGEHDRVRDAWLESRGYRVLRFWNDEVQRNLHGVLTAIEDALASRGPLSPALPRKGGGGPTDETRP